MSLKESVKGLGTMLSAIVRQALRDNRGCEAEVAVDSAIIAHLMRAQAALTEAEYWCERRPGMLKRSDVYIANELRIQNLHVDLDREEAACVASALELVTEAGLDDHYDRADHDRMVAIAKRLRAMDLTPHTPTKDDR